MKLVECVPNFSEARRPEVIDEIAAAIHAVPGARLLDRSSDNDHNRTVLTFAGPPEAVEEAAFQAIQIAAELIDLNQHSGEHPRIGAADVVPFVPVSGVDIQDCVAIARRVGQRVGAELNIPVYLYEAAATRADRQNLANVRRGEFEGLKVEIGTNPEREPDYGPSELGPAGATAIGARPFLIAFNVYLTTDDVEIAKRAARAVRHSSGGLRYVKALGLLVEGRAQVSMNLTDFKKTPVYRAVEMIRSEAQRYGVEVHSSELVGLIPQAALAETAAWYLQWDNFSPELILENRLAGTDGGPQPTDDGQRTAGEGFLDDLAAASAAPGGGSAAAYAAAMGASLAAMVAGLTVGRKKYASVEDQMQSVLLQARELQADLRAAVVEDAAAFEALMAARRLPMETKDQESARAEAVEQATLQAAQVPLEVARRALVILQLAELAVRVGNANAVTDAAAGAELALAGLRVAGYNVRINAASLQDKGADQELLFELDVLETRAGTLIDEIRKTLSVRGGR